MIRPERRPSIGERIRFALLAAIGAILLSVAAGCGASREAAPGDAAAGADRPEEAGFVQRDVAGHLPADAEFVRDMIVHHAQALEMTELVPERSGSETIELLARRIEETQVYEIGLMRDWLEARGEEPPSTELHMHAPHAGMAGMASPKQMTALAAAEGEAFDRRFLELMIRHHEGALVMVDELLEQEGAGREPELYVLLSHVDADQRAEIARMRRMLNEYSSGDEE